MRTVALFARGGMGMCRAMVGGVADAIKDASRFSKILRQLEKQMPTDENMRRLLTDVVRQREHQLEAAQALRRAGTSMQDFARAGRLLGRAGIRLSPSREEEWDSRQRRIESVLAERNPELPIYDPR